MSKANAPMQSLLPGLAEAGLDTTGFEMVAYEQLFNTGNYQNVRVGAAVRVQPGESPTEAKERARAWVEANRPVEAK